MKKIITMLLTFAMVCSMGLTGAFAVESQQATVSPRGVYIRECVGYEPNSTSINYTFKSTGFASLNNTASSIGTIHYTYEKSGSVSASIAGHVNASAEAGVVFAKTEVEVGVELAATRSWSQGMSSGASYPVNPGEFIKVEAFIPSAKTAGRLVYSVYMDGYPQNTFTEYKTLSVSQIPIADSIHFEVVEVQNSRGAFGPTSNSLPDNILFTPSGIIDMSHVG